jgi:hypothetical protein
MEEGEMTTWKNVSGILAFAMMTWGCGMSDNTVFQPKPVDNAKEVAASELSKKLDAEVAAFLRNKYTVGSARYYSVAGEIPWIAVSKSVQNQMVEKSFKRVMFEWYEPGLDFVEVYPQGKAAFAVAMPKGTKSSSDKLVGFYVLNPPAGGK